MININHGLKIVNVKDTDYVLGGVSKIQIARYVKDWSLYLPRNESQRNLIQDFLDCATMAAVHTLEMQMNYLLTSGSLSDEAVNFFFDNGYIKNGKFDISVRYSAKMNGTTAQGNDMPTVAAHFRSDGLLPESDLPMTDTMDWSKYYASISPLLIEKAKKALWFLLIEYQYVNKQDLPHALLTAPVEVATEICAGWDSGQVVQKCSGQPLQHATCIYGIDENGNYKDLDHYPPYQQKFSPDYELPSNMQHIISLKPTCLRVGMRGITVKKLQKALNSHGAKLVVDGKFGSGTEKELSLFQMKNNLVNDSLAGTMTLSKLGITPGLSLIDAMIKIESNGDDHAVGDNGKAFGCLQIWQGNVDEINRKLGTAYQAKDCLGNRALSIFFFTAYFALHPELITHEDKARAWNGGAGWKSIYSIPVKNTDQIQYCNNIDVYWKKVESLL